MPRNMWADEDNDGDDAQPRSGHNSRPSSARPSSARRGWRRSDKAPPAAASNEGSPSRSARSSQPVVSSRQPPSEPMEEIDSGGSSDEDGVLEVNAGETMSNFDSSRIVAPMRPPQERRSEGSPKESPSRPAYEEPYYQEPYSLLPVPQLPAAAMPPPQADQADRLPDALDLVAPLQGWLLKRHNRGKVLGAQWAKRYFSINEACVWPASNQITSMWPPPRA